jgi:hypothetical protein
LKKKRKMLNDGETNNGEIEKEKGGKQKKS